mmetsp:Transcript_19134/g.45626  ORF Transcript_19134/g.45626 Transcript_19134/m.45626 type:complete len:395 (+) Transcript_19134:710-1894(+)
MTTALARRWLEGIGRQNAVASRAHCSPLRCRADLWGAERVLVGCLRLGLLPVCSRGASKRVCLVSEGRTAAAFHVICSFEWVGALIERVCPRAIRGAHLGPRVVLAEHRSRRLHLPRLPQVLTEWVPHSGLHLLGACPLRLGTSLLLGRLAAAQPLAHFIHLHAGAGIRSRNPSFGLERTPLRAVALRDRLQCKRFRTARTPWRDPPLPVLSLPKIRLGFQLCLEHGVVLRHSPILPGEPRGRPRLDCMPWWRFADALLKHVELCQLLLDIVLLPGEEAAGSSPAHEGAQVGAQRRIGGVGGDGRVAAQRWGAAAGNLLVLPLADEVEAEVRLPDRGDDRLAARHGEAQKLLHIIPCILRKVDHELAEHGRCPRPPLCFKDRKHEALPPESPRL